jgi:hypothetical protein
MRRAILALFAVMAVVLTSAAPIAADTTKPVSGTYKSMSSYSQECVPQGARTTCTETSVDVFTETPPTVVVCFNLTTYTYGEKTGRGRVLSSESGCTDPIDAAALAISVSHDQMTTSLVPTEVTLSACDHRTCTETRTVTVSASDTGGPVQPFSNRQTYKDGTCTYRFSETGSSAEVSGSLTFDDTTIPEAGYGQQSEVKAQESCK